MRDVKKDTEERLKNRVRFAYGDSLAEENRIDGDFFVYGSNGVVGTHDQAITTGETIIVGRKGSFGKVQWSDKSCFPIDTTYYIDKTQTQEYLRWLYYALMDLDLDKVNFDSAVPGLIELRKSNGILFLNVLSWFHETIWNPKAA